MLFHEHDILVAFIRKADSVPLRRIPGTDTVSRITHTRMKGFERATTSVLTSQCSHRVDHPVAILPTTAQTRIPKKKTTHERSKERRKVGKKKKRDGRGAWESQRNRTRGKEEEAKLSGGSRERKRKKVKEANAKRRMRYDRGSKFTHPAVIAFGMRTYDR